MKFFKKIGIGALALMLFTQSAFAIGVNSSIGTQNYLKKVGTDTIQFIKDTYELGSVGTPIDKIYAQDLDVAGLFSFGGTAVSDLDMNGYDVDNVGNLNIQVDDTDNQVGLEVVQNDVTNDPAGVTITNAGDGNALVVDSASVATDAIQAYGKYGAKIEQDISDGYGLWVTRDLAEVGSNPLMTIAEVNAASTQAVLNISNAGSGNALTVGGTAVFNGSASFTVGNDSHSDDVQLAFGSSNDSSLDWSTAQATANTLVFGLNDVSNSLIFSTVTNRNKDHDHAAQTSPTLFMHSATDPDTDNTQWVSLYHDGTDGQIDLGTGILGIGNITLNENGNITGTTISSGNGLFIKGGAAGSVVLRGTSTDGSGDPATILRSNATLATAGDKITSFDNNTSEVAYVDYQGRMAVGDGTQALPSLTFAGDSDTGFYLNTGNSVGLSEGGSQVYKWQAGTFYTAKITGNGGGTGGLTVQGAMADGASAIGVTVNAGFALTTPGGKIASFQNATVEKAYIDKDGYFSAPRYYVDDISGGDYVGQASVNQLTFYVNSGAKGAVTTSGLSADRYNPLTAGEAMEMVGFIATGSSLTASSFGNLTSLTNPGDKIAGFYSDNLSTEKAYIDYQGFPAFGKNNNGDPYLELSQPVSNTSQLYLVGKNNSTRGIKLTSTQTVIGDSVTANQVESVLGDLYLKSDTAVNILASKSVFTPTLGYGGGEFKYSAVTQTTDATVTEIWTSAVADNEAWEVEATVTSMESDGSDRATYKLMGLFYRDGGNVTQQGSTISIGTIESDAAWDADFTVDTVNQDINVAVTGAAGTTINWKTVVKRTKVTAS